MANTRPDRAFRPAIPLALLLVAALAVDACGQGATASQYAGHPSAESGDIQPTASAAVAPGSDMLPPGFAGSAQPSSIATPSPLLWVQVEPVLPAGRSPAAQPGSDDIVLWEPAVRTDLTGAAEIDNRIVAAGHDSVFQPSLLTVGTNLAQWTPLASDPDWAPAPCQVVASTTTLIVSSSYACDPRMRVQADDGTEGNVADSEGGTVVWRTTDGITFSPPILVPEAASISGLATDGATFYAAGAIAHERTQGSTVEMLTYRDLLGPFPLEALWASDNGSNWRLITSTVSFDQMVNNLMTGRIAGFSAVAAGPAGVLVAEDSRPSICGARGAALCVDPVRFQVLTPGETALRPLALKATPVGVVTALAATPEGFLAAVVTADKRGQARSEIWSVAPDGSWRIVYASPRSGSLKALFDAYGDVAFLGGEVIAGFSVVDGTYLAVGRRASDALVLSSHDATSWQSTVLGSGTTPEGMQATLLRVIDVRGRLVAFGALTATGPELPNDVLGIEWIGTR